MKSKVILLLLSVIFCLTFSELSAQPNPPGDHGSSGNESPSGGGAPIAGGIGILITLGAAYGAGRWYLSKEKQDE